MDKDKKFIDLSKLTVEQIKNLVPVIEGAGDKLEVISRMQLLEGKMFYGDRSYHILEYDLIWSTWSESNKQEITYPEFLELFEKTERLEDVAITEETYNIGEVIDACWRVLPNYNSDEEMVRTAQKFLEEKGYFVFPKAPEGDFPDLSESEGREYKVKLSDFEGWSKHKIICKIGYGVFITHFGKAVAQVKEYDQEGHGHNKFKN